ncbi:MAG: hypothetical protein ACLR6J_17270 [Parabacteroides merdae]
MKFVIGIKRRRWKLLERQIHILTEARDRLLPKLMNGETEKYKT